MDDGFSPGDVHRGREGVVGRLRPVDVVVGVHGRLAASTPPAISMARLAMTSLAFMLDWVPEPVCQTRSGKWSSSFPSMTSWARGDQVTDRDVQLAKGDVRARRGLLQNAKGADHATGHGVLTDVEINQRAGGLAAVVPVRWNLEFAHGVGFDAHVAHASMACREFHDPFPEIIGHTSVGDVKS